MVRTLDHPNPRDPWFGEWAGVERLDGVALRFHPADLMLTWRPLHPGSHRPVLKDLRAGPREQGLYIGWHRWHSEEHEEVGSSPPTA